MKATKKSTFKVLFYLKKNAPKKNGKITVMCRITVNGKQSAFSTKLDISATNWDLKYGRVLGKSREAQDIEWMVHRAGINPKANSSKGLLQRSKTKFSMASFEDTTNYSLTADNSRDKPTTKTFQPTFQFL